MSSQARCLSRADARSGLARGTWRPATFCTTQSYEGLTFRSVGLSPERYSARMNKPTTRKAVPVDGTNVLYHFLQKDFQVSNEEAFGLLFAGVASALGVWFGRETYSELTHLAPYARRDPESRGNKAKGLPDQWGAPDPAGYMRDDNSEIKGLHRSLRVSPARNKTYRGRPLGIGFVASHVWRTPPSDQSELLLAARDPLTYSFIPNLLWLPSSVAGLTDREGSFAQRYLQALSIKVYRDVPVRPSLQAVVDEAWRRLPAPTGVPVEALPDITELNFFEHSDQFVSRRRRVIASVRNALVDLSSGRVPSGKILHGRYDDEIARVDPVARMRLAERLALFLEDI
jgi:hypothetical protein